MDLKQLSYFVAVIQEGTISGAARRLHLTQPPLSAQMRLLEEESGCLLFERGSRHVQPTAAGQMLYGRAVKMLELADIARQELKDYREGTGGILRLGVVSSAGAVLVRMLGDFHNLYPHIGFELTEGNTYQLLEQLSSGLIEMAVVRTPFPERGLCSVQLLDEPLLAVGRKDFFPKEGPVSLAELADTPLILYRRWESILTEAFRQAGIAPQVICKNDDARTTACWADAGFGVAILPASASGFLRHPDSESRPLSDLPLRSGICLVHSRDSWVSAPARALLAHLTERAAAFGASM
ncbi:MAG: LysR family transcriptional regulator [Eubacteriales bacterium]|nr:LysR family transcriptional regulator [Eubacteriales bacterium]